MYWFRHGAEQDVAMHTQSYVIEHLISEGSYSLKIQAKPQTYFQEHWKKRIQPHQIFENQHAFNQLSFLDQYMLMIEFMKSVHSEKEQMIQNWHSTMKPWVIRLQELVIKKFGLKDLKTNDDDARIYQDGYSSAYVGDYRINLGRSFRLFFPSLGTSTEHDTPYPYVFCLVDKKEQLFSVHGPLPEEASKNIEFMKENQPVKYKEYLKVHAIELEIWGIWHEEMIRAGVKYQPAYIKKG